MAQSSEPEPRFDFTGYVLLDGLDPGVSESDIWAALVSDFSRADETSFHILRNFSPEMCVILKFCKDENAQEMIDKYRLRVPLKGLHGLNVARGLKALSDLERALTGLVDDNVFVTHVKVETHGFENGVIDLITSALSPFGEILQVTIDGASDTGVLSSVWFKYYSSALASQVACHGKTMKSQGIFVVPLTKRARATSILLKWATRLLKSDQESKLAIIALLNASF